MASPPRPPTVALFVTGLLAALLVGAWLAPRPAHGCEPVPCWDLETQEVLLTVTATSRDGVAQPVPRQDATLRVWALAPDASGEAQAVSAHLHDPLLQPTFACSVTMARTP